MHKKILVVVDDRAVTQAAIRQAIELAHAIRADIHFLSVLPAQGALGFEFLTEAELSRGDFQNEAIAHARKMLSVASNWAEQAGVHNFCAIGSGSDGALCVSDFAAKNHCDFIVVGSQAENVVLQYLNGSIVPGLISGAAAPVLVCGESGSNGGYRQRDSIFIRTRQRRQESLERRRQEKND